MNHEEEMEAFYAQDIDAVVIDSEQFRKKLNIGLDAFKHLSNAKKLGEFLTAIGSGTGVAAFGGAAWLTSLGTFGQIGLAVGLVSTPVGWLAAAGSGAAVTVYTTRWMFRKVKKDVVTEYPNFINSPLDVLASSLCDLMYPVLLKIAYADKKYCELERETIRSYFINEWGINPDYVESLLDYDEAHLNNYDWDTLSTTIAALAKSGDLKYTTIKNEILETANVVMLSNGLIHHKELEELLKLEEALQRKPRRRQEPNPKAKSKQKPKAKAKAKAK